MDKVRCSWADSSELMKEYHDTEWGVPVTRDKKHFEYILLDSFQAGLSWSTILNKRENFARAFAYFNYGKVAEFGGAEIKELLEDEGIIRNERKIRATVKNAKAFMKVREEFGTFNKYIWRFVDGETIQNAWADDSKVPDKTKESEKMSEDLVSRGFSFVGPTICYAYMQAAGLVNDHVTSCFRYEEIRGL